MNFVTELRSAPEAGTATIEEIPRNLLDQVKSSEGAFVIAEDLDTSPARSYNTKYHAEGFYFSTIDSASGRKFTRTNSKGVKVDKSAKDLVVQYSPAIADAAWAKRGAEKAELVAATASLRTSDLVDEDGDE